METFIFKALQLIVALVILVTVHEFGHYIFARIFGIKVNRFYLFFNPWFSLLKYDPRKGTLQIISKDDSHAWRTLRVGKPHPRTSPDAKPTWRDTIYGIGWLPLGGYCDIAGMVDETKSSADLASEPQPWEFRSKGAMKRLMVMAAGVIFNFLLAIVIYTGIAFHWGDRVIPFDKITEGMDFSEEMHAAGFVDGDILLALDGKPIDAKKGTVAWDMVQAGAKVSLLRNHTDTIDITIGDELLKQLAAKNSAYMAPRIPVVIEQVLGEGARAADLHEGDRILRVGNDSTPSLSEFYPALADNKGNTPVMLISRQGSDIEIPVEVNDAGKIGIQLRSPDKIYQVEDVQYTFLQSIPRGWTKGIDQLTGYVSSLKLLFSKEGAQSLGGFGTLGSLFPTHWDWYSFWQITAFLSVILAFMNIIPIPALDGGYILFLLVEIITRRKPSERFIEIANTAGIIFLLLLLIYANGNDIYRLIIK